MNLLRIVYDFLSINRSSEPDLPCGHSFRHTSIMAVRVGYGEIGNDGEMNNASITLTVRCKTCHRLKIYSMDVDNFRNGVIVAELILMNYKGSTSE